jgi:AI-2 transport protein TqsA
MVPPVNTQNQESDPPASEASGLKSSAQRARVRAERSLAIHAAMVLGVIVLAGLLLQALRVVLIPLVMAMLLAFVMLPLVGWLVRRKIPESLAILVAEIVCTLPVLGLILVFVATVGPVSDSLESYGSRLQVQISSSLEAGMSRLGLSEVRKQALREEVLQKGLSSMVNEGVALARDGLGTATQAVGAFFLTLLLSGFILFEGRRFKEKFKEAYGESNAILVGLEGIGRDVRAYVIAKTLISALTGFTVFIFLEMMHVDFALFWGLLAFPLNFIPTLGALAASVPPLLIAFVDPDLGGWSIAGVGVGLLFINGFIGSVIDPRYVGQKVRISALVVLVSMLMWGVVWGPMGMILAVPLMVSIKVIFERVPALAPIAHLMKG